MKELSLHRGRIQAQGGGIEESEAWTQATPLKAKDGHSKATALEKKLAPSEAQIRRKSFQDAHEYIDRCKAAGGISVAAVVKKPFPVFGDVKNRRVDVDVLAGKAFVP